MKTFVLKVLLFVACVVLMDCASGYGFSWMRRHAKGGSTANCEYIAHRADEDIIILGSSRATHHYIPRIIEDSLGLSCYNCGEEGNGIVLAYGRLIMLTNRYNPKLVLYEITPGYDYGTGEPDSKYLGYLRAYYEEEGINGIFHDFDDRLYWLKMKSKMYQNTSRILPDLVDNIIYRDNHQGYDPLYGQMTDVGQKLREGHMEIDSLKLSYLEKLIVLCQNKGIPLLFMISPKYNALDYGSYEPALRLCESYGIGVGNFIDDPVLSKQAVLFQDPEHMNHEGAKAYSQNIIPLIKRNIQQ